MLSTQVLLVSLSVIVSTAFSQITISQNTDIVGNADVWDSLLVNGGSYLSYNNEEGDTYNSFKNAVTNDGQLYIGDDGMNVGMSVYFFQGITNNGRVVLNARNEISDPNFNFNGPTFVNNGDIFMLGRGDSDGSNMNIWADWWVTPENHGTIHFHQDVENNGGISHFGRASQTVTNDGTICLHKMNMYQHSNVQGTGCYTVGEKSILIEDLPSTWPLSSGQTIYLASSSSYVRFGLEAPSEYINIAGWGNKNKIGFLGIVFSATISGSVLTVVADFNTFYFNVGEGYEQQHIKIGGGDTIGGFSITSYVMYKHPPPDKALPTSCEACFANADTPLPANREPPFVTSSSSSKIFSPTSKFPETNSDQPAKSYETQSSNELSTSKSKHTSRPVYISASLKTSLQPEYTQISSEKASYSSGEEHSISSTTESALKIESSSSINFSHQKNSKDDLRLDSSTYERFSSSDFPTTSYEINISPTSVPTQYRKSLLTFHGSSSSYSSVEINKAGGKSSTFQSSSRKLKTTYGSATFPFSTYSHDSSVKSKPSVYVASSSLDSRYLKNTGYASSYVLPTRARIDPSTTTNTYLDQKSSKDALFTSSSEFASLSSQLRASNSMNPSDTSNDFNENLTTATEIINESSLPITSHEIESSLETRHSDIDPHTSADPVFSGTDPSSVSRSSHVSKHENITIYKPSSTYYSISTQMSISNHNLQSIKSSSSQASSGSIEMKSITYITKDPHSILSSSTEVSNRDFSSSLTLKVEPSQSTNTYDIKDPTKTRQDSSFKDTNTSSVESHTATFSSNDPKVPLHGTRLTTVSSNSHLVHSYESRATTSSTDDQLATSRLSSHASQGTSSNFSPGEVIMNTSSKGFCPSFALSHLSVSHSLTEHVVGTKSSTSNTSSNTFFESISTSSHQLAIPTDLRTETSDQKRTFSSSGLSFSSTSVSSQLKSSDLDFVDSSSNAVSTRSTSLAAEAFTTDLTDYPCPECTKDSTTTLHSDFASHSDSRTDKFLASLSSAIVSSKISVALTSDMFHNSPTSSASMSKQVSLTSSLTHSTETSSFTSSVLSEHKSSLESITFVESTSSTGNDFSSTARVSPSNIEYSSPVRIPPTSSGSSSAVIVSSAIRDVSSTMRQASGFSTREVRTTYKVSTSENASFTESTSAARLVSALESHSGSKNVPGSHTAYTSESNTRSESVTKQKSHSIYPSGSPNIQVSEGTLRSEILSTTTYSASAALRSELLSSMKSTSKLEQSFHTVQSARVAKSSDVQNYLTQSSGGESKSTIFSNVASSESIPSASEDMSSTITQKSAESSTRAHTNDLHTSHSEEISKVISNIVSRTNTSSNVISSSWSVSNSEGAISENTMTGRLSIIAHSSSLQLDLPTKSDLLTTYHKVNVQTYSLVESGSASIFPQSSASAYVSHEQSSMSQDVSSGRYSNTGDGHSLETGCERCARYTITFPQVQSGGSVETISAIVDVTTNSNGALTASTSAFLQTSSSTATSKSDLSTSPFISPTTHVPKEVSSKADGEVTMVTSKPSESSTAVQKCPECTSHTSKTDTSSGLNFSSDNVSSNHKQKSSSILKSNTFALSSTSDVASSLSLNGSGSTDSSAVKHSLPTPTLAFFTSDNTVQKHTIAAIATTIDGEQSTLLSASSPETVASSNYFKAYFNSSTRVISEVPLSVSTSTNISPPSQSHKYGDHSTAAMASVTGLQIPYSPSSETAFPSSMIPSGKLSSKTTLFEASGTVPTSVHFILSHTSTNTVGVPSDDDPKQSASDVIEFSSMLSNQHKSISEMESSESVAFTETTSQSETFSIVSTSTLAASSAHVSQQNTLYLPCVDCTNGNLSPPEDSGWGPVTASLTSSKRDNLTILYTSTKASTDVDFHTSSTTYEPISDSSMSIATESQDNYHGTDLSLNTKKAYSYTMSTLASVHSSRLSVGSGSPHPAVSTTSVDSGLKLHLTSILVLLSTVLTILL
ncbi:putative hyphally regulated cell wall protein [Clavispora lusitaniae]|uniref:Hyphally regulated cell wall protein n=1 Tax=Clavispora lusitaniae TaxID=36911 RepID=A0ACD0WF52_CLALS|nr:Hyphally regulated cell wall protein N-terminal family protein [Clavispora lusitaniae]QFZ26100.1 putative hyphally regulated cell wall protein [Clavispora lusitaniae]QFZ36265.1 putative hyphally regulated cell wall protein [Clavispora lusitaniae]QFZ41949.1 putative hyphally regulated cell wall protein [Clavispora lusitaniae]QFZ47625.1 putative hyphally regulated cell wall protein [Clavispora lusitaniae]